MTQIGLPFDWASQTREVHFLAGEANASAVRHIEGWKSWPIPISILTGPARSGKSALGRYFARISQGVVIDEAEREPDDRMFHAWNVARDTGSPLLLISRVPPAGWPVSLPDLRSRLAAAPQVRIDEPDDALIRTLFENGLAQAGTAHSADVPEWLARRVERSYAAVAGVLDQLNALSLASGRKISVPSVKEALQKCKLLPIDDGDAGVPDAAGQDRKSSDDV